MTGVPTKQGGGEIAPIRAGIARTFVSFKQIDRLFELNWSDLNRQYLADVDGQPKVVSVDMFDPIRRPEAFDADGKVIGGSTRVFEGVYRAMKCERPRKESYGSSLWTFAREMSLPIKNKRVYVFVAKDENRSGLTLHRELDYGTDGKFRLCDKDGKAVGPSIAWLDLEGLSFVQERRSVHDSYFVMLSPYPLPRTLVQKLQSGAKGADASKKFLSSIAPRLLPLWDPFFTDSAPPESPNRFAPLDLGGAGGNTRLLRMHLVDPVDEAILRAQTFADLHEKWITENQRLGKNAKYRVACHIRNIIEGEKDLEEKKDLEDLVSFRDGHKDSLGGYLSSTEERSRRLGIQVEHAGDAVLKWIGSARQPVRVGFRSPQAGATSGTVGDTFWIKSSTFRDLAFAPTGKLKVLRSAKAAGFANQFIGLFDDFKSEPDTMERLEYLGLACLRHTLAVPGAAGVLEQVLPKLAGEPSASVAAIMKERIDGITKPLGTAKKLWDLHLQLAIPVLRAKDAERFATFKDALLEARKQKESVNIKLRDKGLGALTLAAQIFDTIDKLDQYWENPRGEESWNALSGVVSLYDEVSSLAGVGELPTIHWSRGIFKAKFNPVAFVFEGVDCVTQVGEAFNQRSKGAAFASAVGATGAMMCFLGGAIVGGTGIGMVLVLAGIAVKYGANWLKKHFQEIREFLRHSSWGHGQTRAATDWSFGHLLTGLKNDPKLQERALHELMFGDFEIKFSPAQDDNGRRCLGVSLEFKAGFAPPSLLKVSAAFFAHSGGRSGELKLPTWGATALARGALAAGLEGLPQPASGYGDINISADVTVDVYGDGRFVMRRESVHATPVTAEMFQ